MLHRTLMRVLARNEDSIDAEIVGRGRVSFFVNGLGLLQSTLSQGDRYIVRCTMSGALYFSSIEPLPTPRAEILGMFENSRGFDCSSNGACNSEQREGNNA